ncbi:radical SAM domain protein [Enhygromyxa salina]|uniref:Radical SAM domain protein n=1 Tax=Enhygromyxa salina TaxID=215803 RepID=A0A0C2D2T8_9BACT|nr:radical SAM protein [Enhygromyxa salina]KIG14467.1 radical SAM domain protein [Enhygromyxa salina]
MVDLTRRCNLRCGFCASRSDDPHPELSGAALLDILRAADERGVFEVTLTGGEPLQWPGLEDVAAAGVRLGFTSLQIATNATLIDARGLELVTALAPRRVRISLDGPVDVHEQVRGPGTFARALAGLRRLRSCVDQVEVVTVVHMGNLGRWRELTQMLVAEGVAAHDLSPLHAIPGCGMVPLTPAALRELKLEIASMREDLPAAFDLRLSSMAAGTPSLSAPISELTGAHLRGLYVLVQPDGTLLRGAPAKPGFPSGHDQLGRIGDTLMDRCLDRHPMHFSEPAPHALDLSWAHPAALFGREPRPLDSTLAQHIRDSPGRFRVRRDERVVLLFDTGTFRVHVVSPTAAARRP